jgi:transcriptional regulator with XRE-family HTH domain|nr:MAG TPA: SOS-response transcriptional repressor [Caudoviricetes sp.]
MNGEQLKRKIAASGHNASEVARMIGISQQSFSQSLSAQDIKTGLVEKISAALHLPISYFFDETTNSAVASGDSSVAAINSHVEGNAVLQERVKSLEALVEEKERTIKILMER